MYLENCLEEFKIAVEQYQIFSYKNLKRDAELVVGFQDFREDLINAGECVEFIDFKLMFTRFVNETYMAESGKVLRISQVFEMCEDVLLWDYENFIKDISSIAEEGFCFEV